MAAEWNVERTLEFIQDYRKHTVLWCSEDRNYKNREMRTSTLQSLGGKYGLDPKAVLSKIKGLRSYFHHEHGKVMRKKGGPKTYKPYWFGYKPMMFILKQSDVREGKDTTTTFSTNLELDHDDTECVTEVGRASEDLIEPPCKRHKPNKTPSIDEICGLLKTVNESLKETDEFQIFGDYVASRVCKLNDRQLQSVVQHKINTILFEAEMEQHDLQGTKSVNCSQLVNVGSDPSPSSSVSSVEVSSPSNENVNNSV